MSLTDNSHHKHSFFVLRPQNYEKALNIPTLDKHIIDIKGIKKRGNFTVSSFNGL